MNLFTRRKCSGGGRRVRSKKDPELVKKISAKSQISQGFLYYIAIPDVTRCRFARRLPDGSATLQILQSAKSEVSERSLGGATSRICTQS